MSIISVEIMKIINERERCDTRCVPTFVLKFHVKRFRYFQFNMIEILKLLLTLFKFSSILKPQKQFK